MELSAFRAKLKEVWDKAWMCSVLREFIVYDSDEYGEIYIDETGTFHFSNSINHNWVESYLNIKNVANLRFAMDYYGEEPDHKIKEPDESVVFIFFMSGERMIFYNVHHKYTTHVTVYLSKDRITEDDFNELQKTCSTKELTFVLEEALK